MSIAVGVLRLCLIYCRVLLPCFIIILMICGNRQVIKSEYKSFDARSIVIATFMWSVIMVCSCDCTIRVFYDVTIHYYWLFY